MYDEPKNEEWITRKAATDKIREGGERVYEETLQRADRVGFVARIREYPEAVARREQYAHVYNRTIANLNGFLARFPEVVAEGIVAEMRLSMFSRAVGNIRAACEVLGSKPGEDFYQMACRVQQERLGLYAEIRRMKEEA